jgi:hypothetical protein
MSQQNLDPKTLKHEDVKFLLRYYNPVLRKLMTSNEIKRANEFVKLGWLEKGHSEHRPHSVTYYIDRSTALRILNSRSELSQEEINSID